MAGYTRGDFDHRHKLTGLRMEAMKQTIAIAVGALAIPTAVYGLKMLPGYQAHPGAATLFWLFTIIGVIVSIVALASGTIFLWRAPKWAKEADGNPPAT